MPKVKGGQVVKPDEGWEIAEAEFRKTTKNNIGKFFRKAYSKKLRDYFDKEIKKEIDEFNQRGKK